MELQTIVPVVPELQPDALTPATTAFNRAGTAGNTREGLVCELKLCSRQKCELKFCSRQKENLIHMIILLIKEKLCLNFSASLDLLFCWPASSLLCKQVMPLDSSEHASLPSRT